MADIQVAETMSIYCGTSCERWREQVKEDLAHATKSEVKTVFINQIGPSQYDIRFQIYNESNKHTIIPNWFGTACCAAAAEALAYQDYYQNNI